METESIRDVLHWSNRFHTTLAHRLEKSQEHAAGDRERMLLNYLSEHEQLLADNYSRWQSDTEMDVLKTWSYDYYKTYPDEWLQEFQEPYAGMGTHEILNDVEAQHQQVIEFFDHLKRHAHIPQVVDLLDQLIEMEESEASSMTEASNRLEDL